MLTQLTKLNFFAQKQQKYYWLFSFSGLLIICFISFFLYLGSIGLVDETEPLFAEASKQMILTGDYLTPSFNGEPRFDKPPLIYWLMAFFYQLLGINEWAVRLPSALSSLLLIIYLFFLLKSYGYLPNFNNKKNKNEQLKNKKLWLSAIIGSSICALNLEVILWARQGVSDALLNACIGISLLSFFQGYNYHQPNSNNSQNILPNKYYLIFYIFTALAVLTKGPVGIVLPSLIILSFLAYVGKLKVVILSEMKVLIGIIIFSLITIPWFLLIIKTHGETYTSSFLGYHNLQRFTSVVNNHSAPWYFYFLVLLGGFFPWSIYLPYTVSLTKFWRRRLWQNSPRENQLMLFAFIWFAVIFLFFSISVTKLPSYILPLIPATSILVGIIFSEEISKQKKFNIQKIDQKINGFFKFSTLVAIIFTFLLGIAFYFAPQFISNDPASVDLPQAIINHNIHLIGSILLIILAIICYFLLQQKKQSILALFTIAIIGYMLFLILVFNPLMFQVDRQRQLPLRNIADSLQTIKKTTESATMIGFKKPTLVFYSNQKIQFFTVRSLVKYEDKYLKNLSQYLVENNPNDTTLVIGREKDLDRLAMEKDDYLMIKQEGVYQIRRITKNNLIDSIKRARSEYKS